MDFFSNQLSHEGVRAKAKAAIQNKKRSLAAAFSSFGNQSLPSGFSSFHSDGNDAPSKFLRRFKLPTVSELLSPRNITNQKSSDCRASFQLAPLQFPFPSQKSFNRSSLTSTARLPENFNSSAQEHFDDETRVRSQQKILPQTKQSLPLCEVVPSNVVVVRPSKKRFESPQPRNTAPVSDSSIDTPWPAANEYLEIFKSFGKTKSIPVYDLGLDSRNVPFQPRFIYTTPVSCMYFLKCSKLLGKGSFGFPREDDETMKKKRKMKKAFRWRKMSFMTGLPKNAPLVSYITATCFARNEDQTMNTEKLFRMHVVQKVSTSNDENAPENNYVLVHIRAGGKKRCGVRGKLSTEDSSKKWKSELHDISSKGSDSNLQEPSSPVESFAPVAMPASPKSCAIVSPRSLLNTAVLESSPKSDKCIEVGSDHSYSTRMDLEHTQRLSPKSLLSSSDPIKAVRKMLMSKAKTVGDLDVLIKKIQGECENIRQMYSKENTLC